MSASASQVAPRKRSDRNDAAEMKQFLRWRVVPVLVLLLAMGSAGVALAGDYGRSTDEAYNVSAGFDALAAYKWRFLQDQHDPYYHGTAYFMPYYALPLLATRFAARFHTSTLPAAWIMADLRHLMNFVMFMLTAVGMFAIARRFLRPWPSLVPVLLFVTQPVLFGHAFINQKDTPFMALLTLSIAFGLSAGTPSPDRDLHSPARRAHRRESRSPHSAGASSMIGQSLRDGCEPGWRQSSCCSWRAWRCWWSDGWRSRSGTKLCR